MRKTFGLQKKKKKKLSNSKMKTKYSSLEIEKQNERGVRFNAYS